MYKAAENASDLNPMAPGTVSNSKGKKSNITSGSVYCQSCVSLEEKGGPILALFRLCERHAPTKLVLLL